MQEHADRTGADYPNGTNYDSAETHENRCPKTTADFAYEAVNATGDRGEAASMLRDAAEKVAEGGV